MLVLNLHVCTRDLRRRWLQVVANLGLVWEFTLLVTIVAIHRGQSWGRDRSLYENNMLPNDSLDELNTRTRQTKRSDSWDSCGPSRHTSLERTSFLSASHYYIAHCCDFSSHIRFRSTSARPDHSLPSYRCPYIQTYNIRHVH